MELDLSTFELKFSSDYKNKLVNNSLTHYLLEKIFHLSEIKKVYSFASKHDSPREFIDATVSAMNIKLIVDEEEKKNIPCTGPVIVVANNPSAIDGITLASLMFQIRPDVRCIGDAVFQLFPQFRELLIGVDFKKKSNPSAIRSAMDFLNQGGLVTITPAGLLSHFHFREFKVTDRPWNPTFAKFIHATKVPVVPLYRSLQNSWKYQVARKIHPLLGSLLQPAEFINKRNAEMKIRIGKLIPYAEIANMDPMQTTQYLREKTYSLGRHD